MSRRVIVLGLDGATWDLLDPWIEAGHLPHLARLREEGAWGLLRSTTPPFTATAWTTFATGMNPGKHGIYDFWYRGAEGKRLPIDAGKLRAPTLWQRLSEAGKRVAVVNVPLTYPPVTVNGVMVCGMLTPPHAEVFTHPAELSQEISAAFGSYRPDPYAAITQSARFLRDALRWTEQHEKVHRWLFEREPWDLFMQVIQAPDVIEHLFWTFLQTNHTDYDVPGAESFRQAALSVFQRIDEIVGHRLSALRADDVFILMSDHGMGEATHWFNLNRFLVESGFLTLEGKGILSRVGLTQEGILGRLRRLDRLGLRGYFHNRLRLQVRQWVDSLVSSPVDWTRTVAYAASTSAEAVYLNVRGRESHGVVEPGAEYEAVCEEVIAALRTARDPLTGQPIFSQVLRREDLYHGPYLQHAPDIVLEVGDHPYVMADRLGSTSLLEAIPRQAARGRHRPDGILAFYGEPVRSGVAVEGAGLLDLAPTLMALLGQPVPEEMDGRVLTSPFREPLASLPPAGAAQSAEQEAGGPGGKVAESGYTEEEAAWIEDRLRSLGYLE